MTDILTRAIDIITQMECSDSVYKALDDDDLSEVIIEMLNIYRYTQVLPSLSLIKKDKSEEKSDSLRREGNEAFKKLSFFESLRSYNKALCFAPKDSQALKLAFVDRSNCLYKLGQFDACLNDVETCISLGCSAELNAKLEKRKLDCLNKIHRKNKKKNVDKFVEDFFKLTVERNHNVPCASTDIDIDVKSEQPKIVAAKDIQIGSLIAVEKAFVSINKLNVESCYYCHKISYNLKPCDNCAHVLFCSTRCKESCMKEYHEIECKLMPIFYSDLTISHWLLVKAALKIKGMCDSWADFCSVSNNIGIEVSRSLINKAYDVRDKNCILTWNNEAPKNFSYGQAFTASIIYGMVIYFLSEIPDFFPKSQEENLLAIRALGRIMMYLDITKPYIFTEYTSDKFGELSNVVRSLFAFSNKIVHSCSPNVINCNLDGKMALIALRPIKKGEELTLSRLHYVHKIGKCISQRTMFLYGIFGIVCDCQVCKELWSWDKVSYKINSFSGKQKRCFRNLNMEEIRYSIRNGERVETAFKKICNTLAVLNDVQNSKEYMAIFFEFIAIVELFCSQMESE